MKRLISILFVVFIFSGCQNPVSMMPDTDVELPAGVHTLEDAFNWVGNNIKYKSDISVWGISNHWQSPVTTMSKRTGDCEDCAILFSAFARKLGYTAEIGLILCNGGRDGHAISRIDDIWYDPTPMLDEHGRFVADKFHPVHYNFKLMEVYSIQAAIEHCWEVYNN